MRTPSHILLSLLMLPFYPFFGERIFIAMVSSWFIDLDHIPLLIRERISTYRRFKNMVNNVYTAKDKVFKNMIYVFHTVEFNVVLLIATIWYPIFAFISSGFIFHVICDIIHHDNNNLPVKSQLFITKFILFRK